MKLFYINHYIHICEIIDIVIVLMNYISVKSHSRSLTNFGVLRCPLAYPTLSMQSGTTKLLRKVKTKLPHKNHKKYI